MYGKNEVFFHVKHFLPFHHQYLVYIPAAALDLGVLSTQCIYEAQNRFLIKKPHILYKIIVGNAKMPFWKDESIDYVYQTDI